MRNKKKIVNISGNSCTGKSTLANAISQKIKNSYTITYDKLKKGFEGYQGDKHKPLIKKLAMGLFEVACQNNLTIVLDVFISKKVEYQAYEQIARKFGYKIITLNLTAPLDILTKRFRKRIKGAKSKGMKLGCMDESVFLKNQSEKLYVPKNAYSFDTSKTDLDSIVEQAMKRIKN